MSIVTVVTSCDEVAQLVGWGEILARSFEQPLVVVPFENDKIATEAGDTSTATRPGTTTVRETAIAACNALVDGVRHEVVPPQENQTRTQAVLAVTRARKASHLIVGKQPIPRKQRHPLHLPRALFEQAPCTVVLIRVQSGDVTKPKKVLVAVASGPHSASALRVGAHAVDPATGSELTALRVQPLAGEESTAVGEHLVDRVIMSADLKDNVRVRKKVILSDQVWPAISGEAQQGYDLVLVGASHVGVLRRALFGTVPDRLLSTDNKPGATVAIVRRQWPLLARLRARIEVWLDLAIPQLTRTERVDVFEKLQTGSRWNFDFFLLISLSTAIASLGLLQDSAAVVIGAMLVAPLMTPLLGAGLSLVQGNLPLIRRTSFSIGLGFFTAVAIGSIAGLSVGVPSLTPQLLARGAPNLLDLVIAFLSGIAAAHCSSRQGLSAALPGVAIAAALVPPIATVGICLAAGETSTARGAALLFGTNVVAIVLGAAVSFYGGGIRPPKAENGRRWVRQVMLGLLLILAVLTVPLGSFLVANLAGSPPLERTDQRALAAAIDSWPGCRLERARFYDDDSGQGVLLEINAPAPLTKQEMNFIVRLVHREVSPNLGVRIQTQLVHEATPRGAKP
ncbi:MAG: TIGR00341 family protein [Planctomycetota bacterium]